MPTDFAADEARIRLGGGQKAINRQHDKGRLTARERVAKLCDPGSFFELMLWAGWNMYADWGGAPSGGVVTGVGQVGGRRVMVVANDATVKAGAFFPITCKKVLRAQRIATENRLPLVYLVDSAGVFLPLQDEVFPDEDDFGRIFRNNAVISAAGIPQFAAIMGNCVAGRRLPAGAVRQAPHDRRQRPVPRWSRAGEGRDRPDCQTTRTLGGAARCTRPSAAPSTSARWKTSRACIERLRRLVANLPPDPSLVRFDPFPPAGLPADVHGDSFPAESRAGIRHSATYFPCLLDAGPFDEYKAEFGQTLVCGYRPARRPSRSAVVANQRQRVKLGRRARCNSAASSTSTAADKAARFIMDCNQTRVPIIYSCKNVNGFMVGRDFGTCGHHSRRRQAGQRHQPTAWCRRSR